MEGRCELGGLLGERGREVGEWGGRRLEGSVSFAPRLSLWLRDARAVL